tara:strand:- start:153 stop:632 length:480 start_codon:yes stop_codon:yes gene_type:complete
MSTADSNLHAMSALLTHDIYDHFIRPDASQRERTWVGRALIAVTTIVALILVIFANRSESNPLGMIVILGLLAIAFSTQLLPVAIDILFLQRGTRQGAIAGIVAGLAVVFFLSPFFPMLAGDTAGGLIASMKKMIDVGAWGLSANVLVFILVGKLTKNT